MPPECARKSPARLAAPGHRQQAVRLPSRQREATALENRIRWLSKSQLFLDYAAQRVSLQN
jgi:hypothetical protein